MKRISILTPWSALLGLLLVTASCKHDQEPVQPGNNGDFVASFVGVRWQMAEFKLDPALDIDGDGKPDSDLMRFLRPCDLDNTIVFERSGRMSGDNGKVTCDDDHNDPAANKPGSWTYDNVTKLLRIVDGDDGSVSEWIVVDATAKYLNVRTNITEDGQKIGAVMTWKAA